MPGRSQRQRGRERIRWEIIKSFPRNKKPPFCAETRSFYFPFLFALWSFLTGLWGHVDKRIATFSSSRGQSLIFLCPGQQSGWKHYLSWTKSEKLLASAQSPASVIPSRRKMHHCAQINQMRQGTFQVGQAFKFQALEKRDCIPLCIEAFGCGNNEVEILNWPKEPFKKYQKLTH